MPLREHAGELRSLGSGLVYGEPYRTADGATVITVTGTNWLSRPRPLGVFVVHGDRVSWEPAVDTGRIALIGVLTGLVAATLSTVAVLRRPPWPDVRVSITKRT